jgi:transcription-repair coupling factor (superfamily II helicase)
MEHSDLGSGFQIAMNDLKIRGGGTILGASQSGHIAAVGYDMFLKLMQNAIADLKGQPIPEQIEPEINLSISAFLPESYISDLDQRLIAYRRLARMTEIREIGEFQSELIDRYGKLPDEANNLLSKIALKLLAKKANITVLDVTDHRLVIQFSGSREFNRAGLVDMVMAEPHRFELTPNQRLKVNLPRRSKTGKFVQTKNILKDISQHVNF